MVIHVPKRRRTGGFWFQDFIGGPLRFVDAHPDAGSTVTSAYPKVDGMDAYAIERALDWILNAAGAGRERVERAFRAARIQEHAWSARSSLPNGGMPTSSRGPSAAISWRLNSAQYFRPRGGDGWRDR